MANPTTTSTSTQFSVNLRDIIKGLIMAVLVPVVTIILNSINQGELTFNWKQILIVAIGGFLGYIMKNFLTPAQIVITDKETVQAVKDGDSQVKIVDKP